MSRKSLKVCRLCGRPFYSNRKLYCEEFHSGLQKEIKRGNRSLNVVLSLLLERGEIGVMLDGYWHRTLLEINWVKPSQDTGDSDYLVLSDWGKEKLRELRKELL